MRGMRPGLGSLIAISVPLPASKIASTEESHPSNDAPHPDAGQTWNEEIDGCTFSEFRQRRVWQNNVQKSANIETLRNRKNPHRNQFARLSAYNCDTYNFTFPRRDDFYVAMGFAIGLRAVIVVISRPRDA